MENNLPGFKQILAIRFLVKQEADRFWNAQEIRNGVVIDHKGFESQEEAQGFVDCIVKAASTGQYFDLDS